MLLKKLKQDFNNQLKDIYPTTEIQSFFNLLTEFKLQLTRVDFALQPNKTINSEELLFFKNAISQLKKQVPIQYIIGETEFYGLKFKTNSSVLIPRPETEELVSWIIEDYKFKKQLKILDIGTGSGCIPIALAKNLPNAVVSTIDISEDAISVAKENAKINNAAIKFITLDILNTNDLPEQYDIIVSNPPYVRNLEKEQMQKNVLDFEPHLALFVENENPLLFYDKISTLASTHLLKDGALYFEINQYLGEETSNLVKMKGFCKTELKKDFFNVDRMLKATF